MEEEVGSHEVLRLSSNGLLQLDLSNLGEIHNIWAAFSRAKNCIKDGERLEYLSWRIYSREVAAQHRANAASVLPNSSVVPELKEDTASEDSTPASPEISPQGQKSSRQSMRRPLLPRRSHSGTLPYRLSSHQIQDLFEHPPEILASRPRWSSVGDLKSESTTPRHRSSDGSPSLSAMSQSGLAVNAYKSHYGPQSSARTASPPASGEISNQSASSRATSAPVNVPHSSLLNLSKAPLGSEDRGRTLGLATPIVRGFSPSNVSVSKHRGSALNLSSTKPNAPPQQWEKASVPRGKMFFFEADSESDVASSAGSINERSHGSSDAESDNDPELDIEADAPSKADGEEEWEDEKGDACSNTSDGADDGEEEWEDDGSWSDTDNDDGNNNASEPDDERQRRMFAERDVPLKPLTKPSLLSSLFVNPPESQPVHPRPSSTHNLKKVIARRERALSNVREASEAEEGGSLSDAEVSVPVDILLEAPTENHLPFTPASPRTVRRDMLASELSQSLRDNMLQSRAFDVDNMWRQQSRSRSNSQRRRRTSSEDSMRPSFRPESLPTSRPSSRATSPWGERNFIRAPAMDWPSFTNNGTSSGGAGTTGNVMNNTASSGPVRPELHRTATDSLATLSSGSWLNQHEDIYDPLNYHTRGW